MLDVEQLTPSRIRPLRRGEYDRLVVSGAFKNEKLELLYGRLVQVSPQGAAHAAAIQRLNLLFVRLFGERATIRVQAPLGVTEYSEPEPDLALVPPGEYEDAHPSTAWLVVEVAESSIRDDRLIKGALYAETNVLEYWLVNLVEGVIEVHRNIRGAAFSNVTRHGRGESIAPVQFPDITIAVSEVLPRAR
ncbi:MAG: Uma2 family endonuclease [Myxococcaceae bacterium]